MYRCDALCLKADEGTLNVTLLINTEEENSCNYFVTYFNLMCLSDRASS